MNSIPGNRGCRESERLFLYALKAIPPSEMPAAEAHLAACSDCRQELENLRPIIDLFVYWPVDGQRPSTSLRERLAQRIAREAGGEPVPTTAHEWAEPEWKEVAPGVSCKLLATDTERDRVSMLVRLAPGIAYPPHRHAEVEELHLLDGDLVIDDRTLSPGDYYRADAGSA
ncbi:MAG: cupin domain-containing protein, partial [Planctomycetaceae bacterium]